MEKNIKDTESLSLFQLYTSYSGSWRLLVIGMLLGAAVGFMSNNLRPPVYEAVVVYSFSIDFARTGNLTDIEEDQALEVAGDIIKSSEVLNNTIKAAGDQNIPIPNGDIASIFQAERRFNQWLLKVQMTDASLAARVANLWGEAARTVFKESEIAALKADALQRHLFSLESCLQESTSGMVAQPLCQSSNRTALQAELQASGVDMVDWRAKSNGLFPGLNFTLVQEAQLPSNPVQFTRGTLILAGSLAGLTAALLLSLFIERKQI